MVALVAIRTLWLREVKGFLRQKGRILSMVLQPLAFFLLVGVGLSHTVRIAGAPPDLTYAAFMYPGIIGMAVVFTSSFAAVSLIWEREIGYLREVLVAPVPRWSVAAGKVLGGATVATVQAGILLGLAPVAGVPLRLLSILGILALAFALAVGISGLGVCLASFMSSIESFQVAMNLLVLPLYFLSGGMYPLTGLPPWMAWLMTANPLSYAMDAFRHILFSPVHTAAGEPLLPLLRQAGLVHWSLGLDLAVVAGTAAVLLVLGSWAFSRAQ